MNGASKFAGKARFPLMVLALLLAGLIAAPFALSAKQQSRLPTWLQDVFKELRGYRFEVLRLDRTVLIANRLKLLKEDTQEAFRKEGVADFEISESEQGVLRIDLVNPIDLNLAAQALEAVKTREFDVQTTPEGSIFLIYSSDAIDRASEFAIKRFVVARGDWRSQILRPPKPQTNVAIKQIGTDDVSIEWNEFEDYGNSYFVDIYKDLPEFSANWKRDVSRDELFEITKSVSLPQNTFLTRVSMPLGNEDDRELLELPAVFSATDVEIASLVPDADASSVEITLAPRGQLRLALAVKENPGRQLALVFNNIVMSRLDVGGQFSTNKITIRPGLSLRMAEILSNGINRAVLPSQNWKLIRQGTNRWALIILVIALVLVVLALVFSMRIARREPTQQRE